MVTWGIGVAIAVVAALSGCASQQQKVEQASAIQLNDDTFLPYRQYTSSPFKESGPPLAGEALRANILIGRVDRKSGTKQFAVEIVLAYSENHRRRFESARSAAAEPLTLLKVDQVRTACSKKLESCTYSEVVHVLLPEAGLRAAGEHGYPVKLFARTSDTAVVGIAKPVIAALLAKVDADPAAANAPKAAAALR